jgi:acyl-CoA reductase-like NAD-dependent aldehyde dehydrogenase
MRIAQEEVFGPVVSILECTSFDNAIAIANNIQYGLSTAIYTKDVNQAFRAMRDLEAGITYVNAPTIGAEVHLPFRRRQANRQRPSRRRHRSARLLHNLEVGVCRLLG